MARAPLNTAPLDTAPAARKAPARKPAKKKAAARKTREADRGNRELHSGDFAKPIHKVITAQTRDEVERENIEIHRIMPDLDHLEELKFNDDPIAIIIAQPNEKNPPTHQPVWVNGKGAEMLIGGQFVEMIYLPVGVPLVTKRKYVEALARSKFDQIRTRIIEHQNRHPDNVIDRTRLATALFTVIEDRNPLGRPWLEEMLTRAG